MVRGGGVAVQGDARADHVHVGAGIAQGGGAGPAVVQGEGHAALGQGSAGILKTVELVLGIGLAAVGIGEVSEHASRTQTGRAHRAEIWSATAVLSPSSCHKKPMRPMPVSSFTWMVQHAPGSLGGIRQGPARLQVAHRLGDPGISAAGPSVLQGYTQGRGWAG